MRVMFVDDEPLVLEAVERVLFSLNKDWEIAFSHGGPEALATLEAGHLDVVVSDMRMPVMDGGELLRQMRDKSPSTVRIMLSGHTELEDALRALNVAHRFLSKPCDARQLVEAIESAVSLRSLLDDAKLQELVGGIDRFPPAPRIYAAVNQALLDPLVDAHAIAAILAQDPALTAKVLHLANSAFFRSVKPIGDIQTAVTRIGLSAVRTLVLASEVFDRHERSAAAATLQLRALHASLLAGQIAEDRKDRSMIATAALLADVGKLLTGEDPDQRCTTDLNHVGHAEVGAYLLGLWGLPTPIVEAVAHHHAPSRIGSSQFDAVGVVHVAVALANGCELDRSYLESCNVFRHLPHWRKLSLWIRDGGHD